MTQFFVPFVGPEDQEVTYTELAELVGAGVAQPSQRIFSITWKHNGVEWVAKVGEQLRGEAWVTQGRGRNKREVRVAHSSSDTVLAIFEGYPFLIAHDNNSRQWNLPILAGNPHTVVRFE